MTYDLSKYTDEEKKNLLGQATSLLAKKTEGQGELGKATSELAGRFSAPTVPKVDANKDEELKNEINSNQENDFNIKNSSDEPEVRSKIEEQIKTEQPEVPDYADLFEKYTTGKMGTQYQTSGLETELEDINSMIDRESEIAQERYASADKPVPMGVITGKVSEMERQENVRINALQNRANLIQDQLKTRYDLISNIMGYTKDTYEASKKVYDDEYTRSKEAIDSVNENLQEEQKDALSNWQTISNLISSGSIDYDNMTASQELKISAIESKAGLPQGTLKLIKASNPDKIVTTSISDTTDGKYAYVVTQDKEGNIKTNKMYLGASSKKEEDEGIDLRTGIANVSELITSQNLLGTDKKMSPTDWNILLGIWQSEGLKLEDFLENFSQYVNTKYAKEYIGY